jgi:hypothetical protein
MMSNDWDKPMVSRGFAVTLYKLAWWLEADRNKGSYTGQMPKGWARVLRKEDKPLRDGIVYYSSGHGWRVRKIPHWKGIYLERFGVDFADEAMSELRWEGWLDDEGEPNE